MAFITWAEVKFSEAISSIPFCWRSFSFWIRSKMTLSLFHGWVIKEGSKISFEMPGLKQSTQEF